MRPFWDEEVVERSFFAHPEPIVCSPVIPITALLLDTS